MNYTFQYATKKFGAINMGLTYENVDRFKQKKSLQYKFQVPIENAKKTGFPNCKGLYPDCPEKPTKDNKMCRNCPVLDNED